MNLLIAGIPFLIFITNLAPREKVWDTGIFTITSYEFSTVRIFIYTIIQRIVLLLILFIAFLLTDRYISYGFVVGMALQVYRVAGVLNTNVAKIDEWEWLYVIPIAVIVLWLLFKIRQVLHPRLQIIEIVKEIDRDIEEFKSRKEN